MMENQPLIAPGWNPNGIAFCWQPKTSLHRIRESLDSENSVASALLVYVALTEVASDKRTNTFQTTHAFLGMRCGLAQRTVQARVKDLVSIGLLHVAHNVEGGRGPSTYRLITEEQSLPHDVQPLPNAQQPMHRDTQRSKKAPLPPSEEYNKNSNQESHKKGDTPSHRILTPTDKQILNDELKRALRELERLGNPSDYPKGSTAQALILKLKARVVELRQMLGIIA